MNYIWTIYVWIVSGFSLSFFFITGLLLTYIAPPLTVHKYMSLGIRISLKLGLFKIERIYEEKIDKKGTYIVMPNHVSMLDVLIMAAYQPVYYNAIEADSHFKWFIYGKLIKHIGQIPIDRHDIQSSIESFDKAYEKIKSGMSIIVYPEGTRSRGGKLGEFKTMPFRFAKRANVPIIPVAQIGVEKMSPEKSFWLKYTKIRIVYGKPINPETMQQMGPEELRDYVREKIIKMKEKYAI